jgi:DNA-binding NtrC family response regulator
VHTDDPRLLERLRRHATIAGVEIRRRPCGMLSEGLAVFDARCRVGLPEVLASRLPRGVEPTRPLILCSEDRLFVYGLDDLESLLRRIRTLTGARRIDLASILRGRSEAMVRLRELLQRVAPYDDVNVFVYGPTGSGKELVARALHQLSAAPGAFVGINCAAVAASLFESELFGHQRGAFTGATERHGLLESANEGTVFLDEVAEMPLDMQAKLLRALETRRLRPVGANEERPFRVRFVSATNRRPSSSVLRRDLFFRLAGVTVTVPPLCERAEDVLDLAPAFLEAFCERQGLPVRELTASALEALQEHDWPGNVRELKSVAEQLAMEAWAGRIGGDDVRCLLSRRRSLLASSLPPPPAQPAPPVGPGRDLRDLEREIILQTLEANHGNVAKTARDLGLPRSTLRARLRRYGAS